MTIKSKYFKIKKLCLGIFRVAEFEFEAQNSKWRIQYDKQVDEIFISTYCLPY